MYTELVRNMYEKAKGFDSHLTRIKTLNNGVINRTEKLLAELNTMFDKMQRKDSPPTCGICFTNPKTHCLVSCGHCSCGDCATRAQNGPSSRCFVCRATITDVIRVYC